MDPTSVVGTVKATHEVLGIVAKQLDKLRARPDVAALKLSMALDEIVRTYVVIDAAFNSYASLAIDEDALSTRSQDLLAVAGGALSVQVHQGRGDCYNISLIYDLHLKKWFARVLNRDGQRAMEDAFLGDHGLADTDLNLFRELGSLADRLSDDAKVVLELVYEGRLPQARKRVWTTYKSLEPVQSEIAASMRDLITLKDEFAQLARSSRLVSMRRTA